MSYLGAIGCQQCQITGSESEKQRKAEAWFSKNIQSDKEKLNEFLSATLNKQDGPRLPVVIWSRLYFDLEPYLSELRADGTYLFGFYHRDSFTNAVIKKCVTLEGKTVQNFNLLNYFEGSAFAQLGPE